MYDPHTASIIRQTPDLPELNRQDLPDALTRAFTEIASARVMLRDEKPGIEQLSKTLDFAQRLARTNEALILVSPERENRTAAAFVAATAYQLVHQAEAIREPMPEPAFLRAEGISPDISAMLLFLAAEAWADAAEVSRKISFPEDETLQASLIWTLIRLARGQIGKITGRHLLNRRHAIVGTEYEQTVAALYYQLLRGIRVLAFRLKGRKIRSMVDPIAVFEQVKTLATPDAEDRFGELQAQTIIAFPGPFHLASLLIILGQSLLGGAVVNLPAPQGIDEGRWRKAMQDIAATRPYLWRNHKNAVDRDYLIQGISSVIGFPTGAGKSTVSQLKIHAALLSNHKVVFLAPTNALVDQTAHDLNGAFKGARVRRQRENEFNDDDLPDILVMTPEACLAVGYSKPSAFADVGLLIFDECHLIHPKTNTSKRAVDAMLCILMMARIAPNTDFILLSAMMKNSTELAGWIEELTGRRALALDDSWKPTRQIRGCVVYDLKRLKALESTLKEAQLNAKGGVPSNLKCDMKASPLGLFSVQQTWATKKRDHYALVPFYREELPFNTNKNWKLTPNSGHIASALAVDAANVGVRTLVFATTIPRAESIKQKTTNALGPCSVDLNEIESRLLDTIIDELGDVQHLYLPIKDGKLVGRAACHHGLLLHEERQLVERLYRRNDAISVLAATSTLAQGMNLPAELVILSSDSQFEPDTGRQETLKAENLLNSAGRAGRAGENATGMVLIIPSKVTGINDQKNDIGSQLEDLRKIFSKVDQCLVIDDPLIAVMDRIHSGAEEPTDFDRYVVIRLNANEAGKKGNSICFSSLQKSLGAYRKKQAGDAEWVQTRTEAALRLLSDDEDASENKPSRELAARFGFPEDVLAQLKQSLQENGLPNGASLEDWCNWVFAWLEAHPDDAFRLIKPRDFEYLLGSDYKKLETNAHRVAFALPLIRDGLYAWMKGKPLNEIQKVFSTASKDIKRVTSARKFVIRLLPELGHLMGCLTALQEQLAKTNDDIRVSAACSFLNRATRRGFSSAEMAVFYTYFASTESHMARREVHRRFADISEHLQPGLAEENSEATRARIKSAMEAKN